MHHERQWGWWWGRGRRGRNKGNGRFGRQTVVIEGKVVVAVGAHQTKGGPTGTIHGRFAGLAPSPSQIDATHTGTVDVGLFGCDARLPADVGCVHHAMALGVLDKGIHGRVEFVGAVLFDSVRFASQFWVIGEMIFRFFASLLLLLLLLLMLRRRRSDGGVTGILIVRGALLSTHAGACFFFLAVVVL